MIHPIQVILIRGILVALARGIPVTPMMSRGLELDSCLVRLTLGMLVVLTLKSFLVLMITLAGPSSAVK
jgi:hypothetical protein